MNDIEKEIYNLCLEIEKLPAGEQQTKISMMASDILRKSKSWQESQGLVPLDESNFPIMAIQRICNVGLSKAMEVRDLICSKFGTPPSGNKVSVGEIEKLKSIIKYQIDARGGRINPKDDFNGFINDIYGVLNG